MWNNTDTPLAYFISFRTYGTWLHGDERGSVDRFHNRYRTPRIKANDKWQRHNQTQLKADPATLDSEQRKTVEDAVREVCEFRSWRLHAVNVRTNHIHAVVSVGSTKPERVLNDFKSYGTRRMREQGCWRFEHSPWVDKGSKRYLWNERSVALAIDYVVNGQGDDLPDFG